MQESTPKHLRVIGYPPCPEGEDCSALGFDASDPMEIAQINYDATGTTIQTFDSVWTQAAKFAPQDEEDDDDDDDDDDDGGGGGYLEAEDEPSSCSKETASCSTPPRMDVAGITVKVLENWGAPEYTCLYRFRVHGEPVFS